MADDPSEVTASRARSLAHEYGHEANQLVIDADGDTDDYEAAARKYRHAAQFAQALAAGLPGGER